MALAPIEITCSTLHFLLIFFRWDIHAMDSNRRAKGQFLINCLHPLLRLTYDPIIFRATIKSCSINLLYNFTC